MTSCIRPVTLTGCGKMTTRSIKEPISSMCISFVPHGQSTRKNTVQPNKLVIGAVNTGSLAQLIALDLCWP